METPPAVLVGGTETLAAAKRARKRSRYLSSDYDTAILIDDDHDIAADSPRKRDYQEEEDAAALLLRLQQANLAATDLLAALLRSAASPGDNSSNPGPGVVVDSGVLLRFFALHRASVLAGSKGPAVQHQSKGAAVPAPAGHGQGLPDTCVAFALVAAAAAGSAGKEQDGAVATGQAYAAHDIGPANSAAVAPAPEDSVGQSKRNKNKVTFASDVSNAAADCSAQPSAGSAVGHAYGHHIAGPADAAPAAAQAGRKRGRKKKAAFALDVHNAAAATGYSAQQPVTGIANGFDSAPKKAKKKARNGYGQEQGPGKPVALVLEFTQGVDAIHQPSREELLSTFRGFGSLIESDTDIGTRRSRLVFGSSAAAEAAYSCSYTLGTFCNRRLQYLRPPPVAPKIPLVDVRKNLEKMIASLTGPSLLGGEGALDLAGQMLCLMAKVDKTLCAAGAPGPSTATARHRH